MFIDYLLLGSCRLPHHPQCTQQGQPMLLLLLLFEALTLIKREDLGLERWLSG